MTKESAVPSAKEGTDSPVAPEQAVTEADSEDTISQVNPIFRRYCCPVSSISCH